jgi:crotonobetainyl-CoA:carnitine CoA-transferase CaiB-like acyl-CoA transferase
MPRRPEGRTGTIRGTVTPAPLDGIRVVDLTTFLSGPYATLVLGQLGAEVIKVEPPTGDPTRGGQPVPTNDFWFALHRGRQSVVLDLKVPAARDVLLDLVGNADVFVENYRPGVTTRLGIEPAVLRAANDRLITCSISGYGPRGPLAGAPAIDGVVQAFTGAFTLPPVWGLPEGPVPFQIADLAGGTAAGHAILAALYARERSGRGTHIELSLAECLLSWLMAGDRTGTLRSPNTILATGSDGAPFVVQTTLHFRARLASVLGLTFEPTEAYADAAREVLATRSRDEWLATLLREGIPAAAIQSVDDALEHPQIVSERIGARRVPANPFVLDGDRPAADVPPPVLGAHTDEVLRGLLGYDADRIAALRAGGACGANL